MLLQTEMKYIYILMVWKINDSCYLQMEMCSLSKTQQIVFFWGVDKTTHLGDCRYFNTNRYNFNAQLILSLYVKSRDNNIDGSMTSRSHESFLYILLYLLFTVPGYWNGL